MLNDLIKAFERVGLRMYTEKIMSNAHATIEVVEDYDNCNRQILGWAAFSHRQPLGATAYSPIFRD
jgi:hypothetical protein